MRHLREQTLRGAAEATHTQHQNRAVRPQFQRTEQKGFTVLVLIDSMILPQVHLVYSSRDGNARGYDSYARGCDSWTHHRLSPLPLREVVLYSTTVSSLLTSKLPLTVYLSVGTDYILSLMANVNHIQPRSWYHTALADIIRNPGTRAFNTHFTDAEWADRKSTINGLNG